MSVYRTLGILVINMQQKKKHIRLLATKYKHTLEARSTLNDGRRISFHKSLKQLASFNERQNLD
jgi:hypothetical protein